MERIWWKEGIAYQIWPRSFKDSDGDGIGDLGGITEKLDYLKGLGIDIIWLNPVYQSPMDDMGYDISDYQHIWPRFGTMEDFDHLLAEVHKRGMRLIMDLVVNHTSDEHPWFLESKQSRDGEKADWYIWRDEPNNWGSYFGGSAWTYVKERGQYYLHTFGKKQPELNWECKALRQAIWKMMRFWGDNGIDGFRMDVINGLSKVLTFPDGKPWSTGFGDPTPYVKNGPKIHDYLQEMNREVLSRYDWFTVGEGSGGTPEEGLLYVGQDRHELDECFIFMIMEALKPSPGNGYRIKPFDLVSFKQERAKWMTGLEKGGWSSCYLENHDVVRSVSFFGKDHMLAAKMLATLVLFEEGTPFIYMGEEIGMTNFPFTRKDQLEDLQARSDWENMEKLGFSQDQILQVLQKQGRDNSRTPMQWTGGSEAGFTTGKSWMEVNPNKTTRNVEDELKDPESILSYYQEAIKVRKHHIAASYGTFRLIAEHHPAVYAWLRSCEGETLLVACNFTDQSQQFPIPQGTKILGNHAGMEADRLRPYEAIVVVLDAPFCAGSYGQESPALI